MRELTKQRGYATLEAALYAALLILVVTGAIALIERLRLQSSLGISLEKGLYNSSLLPLTLSTSASGASLQLNSQALSTHLDLASQTIESELQGALGGRGLSAAGYRIEARYFEISVNRLTGEALGITSEGPLHVSGSLSVPAELQAKTDLQTVASAYVQEMTDSSGRFLYAAPTTAFGGAGSNQYLDKAVLLSARVFLETPQGITANFLNTISAETVMHAVTVTALRGEVSL